VKIYLDNYISDLLHNYECVIIPEFGAFITHYKSAEIDSARNTIIPPSKRIAFNPSLKTNDGLLIHYIAEKEKLAYSKASELVSSTVEDWNIRMNDNQIVYLINIGELSKGSESKIVFNPLFSYNFLLDSFCLDEVELTPVERKKIELDFKDFRKFERKTSTHSSKRILVYSLSGYIPILIGLWALFLFKEPKIGRNDQSSMNILSQSSNLKSPERTLNLVVVKKEIIAQKPVVLSNFPMKKDKVITEPVIEKPVTSNEPLNEPIYYIIGASFETLERALVQQKEFQADNYDSKIVKSKYGKYRVSLNQFADVEKAKRFLSKVKESDFESAWIIKSEK
jgi:nucleoid DNA-binding protein